MWDAGTGRPVATLKGHEGGVTSSALSGEGARVLTGSTDHNAILWDAATAKPIQVFKGHTDWVTSVALGADGKRAVTGSEDKTAILWDVATAKPVLTFKGHAADLTSVALSADGKRAVTGSKDKTAILWDVATGEPIQRFKGHESNLLSAALTEDGMRLLTVAETSQRLAAQWDTKTGKALGGLEVRYVIRHQIEGWSFSCASQGGDCKRFVAGDFGSRIATLWDAETFKPIQSFKSRSSSVTSIALDGNGDAYSPGRRTTLRSFGI